MGQEKNEIGVKLLNIQHFNGIPIRNERRKLGINNGWGINYSRLVSNENFIKFDYIYWRGGMPHGYANLVPGTIYREEFNFLSLGYSKKLFKSGRLGVFMGTSLNYRDGETVTYDGFYDLVTSYASKDIGISPRMEFTLKYLKILNASIGVNYTFYLYKWDKSKMPFTSEPVVKRHGVYIELGNSISF